MTASEIVMQQQLLRSLCTQDRQLKLPSHTPVFEIQSRCLQEVILIIRAKLCRSVGLKVSVLL